MATYSPSAPSSAKADGESSSGNDCFQYCIPDRADDVQSCLARELGAYRHVGTGPTFKCFNVDVGGLEKTRMEEGEDRAGYSSGAMRVRSMGGVRWTMSVVLGVGFVSAVMGSC